MTKAEILAQIKTAEDDAKSIISEAKELKIKKVQESKNKARELVKSAEIDSVKLSEQKIAQAKELFTSEKGSLLKKGLTEAETIKSDASRNIKKTTDYLVEQFERAINA
ncbi:MAG: ATP synthase archaeal subunit H [Methanosarcinales archaeon]|nr:ATP synthase archaeal subunit H [Methanosarcinales archaeon]